MKERHRHGGDLLRLSREAGLSKDEILDFSANINPLGPPEWLRPLISSRISDLVHYPDPDCAELTRAVADANDLLPEQIMVGNGATELLHLLPRVFGKKQALVPVPSYADYEEPALLAGLEVQPFFLKAENDFLLDPEDLSRHLTADHMVLLGQPNNPTGRTFCAAGLSKVARRYTDTLFVIDESFIDFTDGTESLRKDRPDNVIVIQSLTKAFAIPGLRLGYGIASADLVRRVRRHLPNWNINVLAQAVGIKAMGERDFLAESREFVTQRREELRATLSKIPALKVFEGEANYLLVRLDAKNIDAPALAQKALKEGVALRVCDNFVGLDSRYFRVAVRTEAQQERLCTVLRSILAPRTNSAKRRKTPAVMFQGTGSNAGKSVLTAALCRILLQDGYSVAPFKAQNMSLNSAVTPRGGEMGRAQVVQAQACRLDPDVRMNPVLLKPNSDTGSQVIVRGKATGNMHFRQYATHRATLFDLVKETYDSLASEHDVMVLEGAGSPGEVNLKAGDIVNMNMARYAEAPVLLVGDIDRGGVFASFVGTMEVLNEWERSIVAGFVVNRFRGDKTLLGNAMCYTRMHTGRPVLGIVPYLKDLGLPEEDSVEFKDGRLQKERPAGDVVDIAVIDLPHISNFTDMDALTIEPDVHVRIVKDAADLGRPDAVILPGSKNVMGDMAWLDRTGLGMRILNLAKGEGCDIVGICGGFQILGECITDPHRIESDGGMIEGLGLLPVTTVLEANKTTTRTQAIHLPSEQEVTGYEIHHGRTQAEGLEPLIQGQDGSLIGVGMADGRIWGTYLHGVFDADSFRRWFIDRLRRRRGWEVTGEIVATYDLEPAFDRLADVVRDALDMESIYKIMGL